MLLTYLEDSIPGRYSQRMARTSQTELAVLGALSVEPMTGYRVRAAIQETLGHFWHESFGQIYPALAALEAEGLVERAAGERSQPYAITRAGAERLRSLLAEPFTQPPPRNPLLLRLFFGWHVGDDVARGWIEQALAEAEAATQQYAALREQVEREAQDDPRARYWLLTVTAGQHGAAARAAWAREALELLDA